LQIFPEFGDAPDRALAMASHQIQFSDNQRWLVLFLSEYFGVVNKSGEDNGYRFETPVRVYRKTGNGFSMVHSPTIFNREILVLFP